MANSLFCHVRFNNHNYIYCYYYHHQSLLLLFIIIVIIIIVIIVIIVIGIIVIMMSAESNLVTGKLGPSAKGVEGVQLVWPTVQQHQDSTNDCLRLTPGFAM